MSASSTSRIFPTLLAVALLGSIAAAAQIWRGQGRLQGTVLDDDEKPFAGARVRLLPAGGLVPAEGTEEGPPPAVTDDKGHWTVAGLAQGRWRLIISAEGFLRSEGWADVGPTASPRIRVVLRPLTEVPPFAAESPGTVVRWLEQGNTLLEQGETTAAREAYERALAVLPPEEQPEVLRAVARTHYLEQNPEGAVNALQRALLYAPGDGASRQLFTALLEGLGRGAEARSWLARLDDEGPEALAPKVAQPADAPYLLGPRPVDDAPTLPPLAGRTGSYRTAFAERSPFSALEVYLERYREERAEAATNYDLRDETFEVHVPEGYDPATPYGLLVWVSPSPSGGVRRPDNLEVLADRRVVWVGANNAGNPRPRWDRIGLALDAAHAMAKLYTIDERRVYVGGYSGGGRVATGLAVLYPEVFRGGILFMGCDYHRRQPVPDKPGAYWPAAFPEPPRPVLKLVRERNRYVFVTGERDFNRMQTRVYHRLFEKDGFRHATYLEIPGADHYSGFGGEWLAKFFDALDDGL